MFIEEPTSNTFVSILYGILHAIPILISLIVNAFMIYTMIRRKQLLVECDNSNAKDHITHTVTVLLLVNLLLDVPHVISHTLESTGIPSLAIHILFHSHVVIDPVIFVGMNPHYWQGLTQSLGLCTGERQDLKTSGEEVCHLDSSPPTHGSIITDVSA
ncbi:hypothetical protein SK128_002046 [Halocaridina rubra]|uniref:Uncharacterized protein n=1 Tax=Halocaridina rubra TaxID=373956 RepID=A0AAN8WII8_HALRR